MYSFIVSQIDRLYQWQSNPHSDVRNTLNKQKPNTKLEFEERAQIAITQLAEQVKQFNSPQCLKQYVAIKWMVEKRAFYCFDSTAV